MAASPLLLVGPADAAAGVDTLLREMDVAEVKP
jgi:hypothetical protein